MRHKRVRTGAANDILAAHAIRFGFNDPVKIYLKTIHCIRNMNNFKNIEFKIKSKYQHSVLIKLFINTRSLKTDEF